jgi:hypothetical protein
LKIQGHLILELQRQMIAFRTFRNNFYISPRYGHIWQLILRLPNLSTPIPHLVVEELWSKDLGNEQSFLYTSTLPVEVNGLLQF